MNSPYQHLLESLRSSRLREDALELPSEIELQSLFFAGHFGRDFIGADNESIRIIQFGEWNHGPGPDFLHGAIEVNGKLRKGPIELDIRPLDWEAHGHATNPAFDEVILHLTIEPASRTHFTRNSRHQQILHAPIPRQRIIDALPAPPAQAPVTLGRCSVPLADLPVSRIADLLKQAALHRATRKANHFRRIADSHGYAQALWQTLATALGYHQNRLAMTLLAQRAPLSQLRNLAPLERSSLLFGLGGFLTADLPDSAPPESRLWLADLWSAWWKHRPHPDPRPIPWQLAGVRPTNHPQRRTAALASTLEHWPSLEKASRQSLADFEARLTGLSDPFWNEHYTLTAPRTARKLSLIGKQRARDFLINTLHPLALQENPESHWPLFAKIAGGPPSDRVKRAAYRLFGNRPDQASFLRKAWQQQALLQIYQDFCLVDHSDCQRCQFPEQLQTW
ncbi:MAG: DUF2851 family protein [Verrucomicrobiota bacterium JB023]|nr:DUF2851 family protein [Verrucomicrobiota bacterium JB023]